MALHWGALARRSSNTLMAPATHTVLSGVTTKSNVGLYLPCWATQGVAQCKFVLQLPGAAGREWGSAPQRGGPTIPRTHCRPRNHSGGQRPPWRYYICFDCSGHPAVPCRVWHGKAGDITRCGVSPRVLGRLLWFGTAGGSLLQWPIQMINEQVRPLL